MRAFSSPEGLAEALTDAVAGALRARIVREGFAALAVSGGTTPVKFFRALSEKPLDWTRVTVTLVDERWVDEASPRSNAALVRAHLLQNQAAAARFLPLYSGAATPEAGCTLVQAALGALPLPFAAIVLGMGTDGHTASFFPGGDHLAAALDPAGTALALPMHAPGAGEPRITLTLPVLLAADYLALHIEGEAKRAVLAQATHLPVGAVLARRPGTDIFWSP